MGGLHSPWIPFPTRTLSLFMPDSSFESLPRDGRPVTLPIAETLWRIGRLSYEMQYDDREGTGPVATRESLERLTEHLVGLKDLLERPPAGYEQLADVLRRVGLLVRTCRQMEWWDARDHYPEFNSLYQHGMELLYEARKRSQANDPLAFLDAPAETGTSTTTPTPTLAVASELVPSQASTSIEVDLDRNRIVIDGTEYFTTGETARMARLLVDHQGEWVAMSKHGFTKPSEVKRRLPAPLLARVEAEKGKGYRLR